MPSGSVSIKGDAQSWVIILVHEFKTSATSIMKTFIVLAALFAAVLAAPQDSKNAEILRYESDNIGVDGYKFAFETSDGVKREETGELKNAGTENEAIVVRGSFTWRDLDGKEYTINFVADENGYRPEGAHLNQ